ncbi:hypothetical protein DVH24_005888 [Malus domestica]|uniref:Autophagy-related protein n=1 Tax=Malus domestica TaxID=3750 RepID=A0A498INC7_MALDO|nr:hypothetical protein DVH24_005888 [Malus domestica]
MDIIREHIEVKERRPWKKAFTLMPVIDKENPDDDGFLNITYSGQEKGGWTN